MWVQRHPHEWRASVVVPSVSGIRARVVSLLEATPNFAHLDPHFLLCRTVCIFILVVEMCERLTCM